MSTPDLISKARAIQLLILDVDGVLTDGKIWMTADGQEMKSFHIHDGLGIQLLQQAGIKVAIISGRHCPVVTRRMKALGVEHVYQGQSLKTKALNELMLLLQLPPQSIAYVGDDLVDLPVMTQVGLSIAVANAVTAVKQQAMWQTHHPGGHGAVREVCDFILSAHGRISPECHTKCDTPVLEDSVFK